MITELDFKTMDGMMKDVLSTVRDLEHELGEVKVRGYAKDLQGMDERLNKSDEILYSLRARMNEVTEMVVKARDFEAKQAAKDREVILATGERIRKINRVEETNKRLGIKY